MSWEYSVERGSDVCYTRTVPNKWVQYVAAPLWQRQIRKSVGDVGGAFSSPQVLSSLQHLRNGDWCWTCTQRRTLEANINQPSDLVSWYPQEYRASASMVTAHREVDRLQLSNTTRKNNIVECFVMHSVSFPRTRSGREGAKDSESTSSGSYTLILSLRTSVLLL